MHLPQNIHLVFNDHSQRKLPTHSHSFTLFFSNGAPHIHRTNKQRQTHTHNTAIIDDLEYNESKASVKDEKSFVLACHSS